MTTTERRQRIRYSLDFLRNTRNTMKNQNETHSREYENLEELIAQFEEFVSYYNL